MEIENLKALIYNGNLTAYQRSLAIIEFQDLLKQLSILKKAVENTEISIINKCEYLFFRADGFYTLELKDDKDAIINAEYNKGTLQVVDIKGRIIWKKN